MKRLNYWIFFIAISTATILFSKPALAESSTGASTCRIGTYITSLQDLSPTDKSVSVHFWLWSLCPSQNIKPLDSIEIINAKKVSYEQELNEYKQGLYWSQRQVKAVLNHNWNTENFPFDRQVFKIEMENGFLDNSKLEFQPDKVNSTYSKDIKLGSQRITNFDIAVKPYKYPTTFGDPSINQGSQFSRFIIQLTVARNGIKSFLKLNTGTYLAFLISLLSFLLHPSQSSIFSARMSLLVGSLFAVVINLRASEAILGRTDGFTLVDKIHVLTMIYIFVAAITAIISQKLCEAKKEKLALRYDMNSIYVFAISFAVINIIMIAGAAIQG